MSSIRSTSPAHPGFLVLITQTTLHRDMNHKDNLQVLPPVRCNFTNLASKYFQDVQYLF
jgi:hypothetical protein